MRTIVPILVLSMACSSGPPSTDGDSNTPPPGDRAQTDSPPGDPNQPSDTDGGDPSSFACGGANVVTSARLWPEPGELFYAQIGVAGFAMGESAVVVGPAGEILFIDLGNNSHASTIRDFLNSLITAMNNHGGYSARGADTANHVIITHYHADHSDGLENFLGSVSMSGRVVTRGFYDLVGITDATVQSACSALASNPGLELELCAGVAEAGCNAGSWVGTYPASSCSGATGTTALTFSAGSGVNVIGVNGYMGGDSYEAINGPLLTENNGENARSIAGVLKHGPFRLIFAGDLTGGGSSTDPMEGFYVPRLAAASDLDSLGVDVMHAGHHGRNTSSSAVWVDALLPNDGHHRNVVMGISPMHANSPHQEVLDTIFTGRLGQGRGWTTRKGPFGQNHANLVVADGHILIRTHDQGRGYYIQAINDAGNVVSTRRFDSVKACP